MKALSSTACFLFLAGCLIDDPSVPEEPEGLSYASITPGQWEFTQRAGSESWCVGALREGNDNVCTLTVERAPEGGFTMKLAGTEGEECIYTRVYAFEGLDNIVRLGRTRCTGVFGGCELPCTEERYVTDDGPVIRNFYFDSVRPGVVRIRLQGGPESECITVDPTEPPGRLLMEPCNADNELQLWSVDRQL